MPTKIKISLNDTSKFTVYIGSKEPCLRVMKIRFIRSSLRYITLVCVMPIAQKTKFCRSKPDIKKQFSVLIYAVFQKRQGVKQILIKKKRSKSQMTRDRRAMKGLIIQHPYFESFLFICYENVDRSALVFIYLTVHYYTF